MADVYQIKDLNLIELLRKELLEKGKNWTTKEKVDYIYIRMCQMFNFDERWFFSPIPELKKEIFDLELDSTKVNRKKLVCSSFSKLFSQVVNTLLEGEKGFDMAIPNGQYIHMYTECWINDSMLKYDPVIPGNDFLYAKLGLPLRGISNFDADKEDDEIILEQEKNYHNVGYDIYSYLSKLRRMREQLLSRSRDPHYILDYLMQRTHYDKLGIYEVNGLLSLKSKKLFGESLKKYGIEIRTTHLNDGYVIHYCLNDEPQYEETEDEKGVNLQKIKK